jgi:hypothetical protein
MMAYCHAAVLLLTKNSVKSDWVLKEATILAWRAALDKDFRLFVVRDPAVTDNELRDEKYAPLGLDNRQRVTATAPENIARTLILSMAPADIAKEVFSTPSDSRAADTPLDLLSKKLAPVVANIEKSILDRIRPRLEIDEPWRPSDYGYPADAVLIARRLIRGELGTYPGVAELIDELTPPTLLETVKYVYQQIAPYWIPSEDAGLLPALGAGTPQRSAALVGNYVCPFTARIYIWRAHPATSLFTIIDIPDSNSGDLFSHISTEIYKWHRGQGFRGNDAFLLKDLNEDERDLYAVCPLLPPDDVIDKLVEQFKTVRFIFGVDALSIGPQTGEQTGFVKWRRVEIDQYQEHKQWNARKKVMSIINNRSMSI